MKLITFYSDSHKDIYENYFLKSYNEHLSNYKLIATKIEQYSPTGQYESEGFDVTVLQKINLIIENIDLSDNETLIYSDCDVQFFGDINYDIGENDIMFQNDYYDNNYCMGFFIAKQNQAVLDFFIKVRDTFIASMDGVIHDQTTVNRLFKDGYDGVKKDMLPSDRYWTVAFSTNGEIWVGQKINLPPNIAVHHANFTYGVKNKILLLEEVKKFIIK
jgi:hypothetical protein